MRLTSSMLADIWRMEAAVSSAFADSSSMFVRTLLIDASISVTEAAVDCVDWSCSAVLPARTRERPLI